MLIGDNSQQLLLFPIVVLYEGVGIVPLYQKIQSYIGLVREDFQ